MTTFWSTLGSVFETVLVCVKKHFPDLPQPVCRDHGICWCDLCVKCYKEANFTVFRNRCEHFDAQCITGHLSTLHINQIEFLLRYVDYLVSCDEDKMLEESKMWALTINLLLLYVLNNILFKKKIVLLMDFVSKMLYL